jgi:dihydrofolate reductase
MDSGFRRNDLTLAGETPMPAIRGYMAMSIDGLIADSDGGIGFLKRYEGVDYGFAEFFAGIGTCVCGRDTFETSLSMAEADGPFPGKRLIVVTTRPLRDLPAGTEVWDKGVDAAFVEHLRRLPGGDVWIVGGGKLQRALFDLGAIDRMQLAVVPVVLGPGVPMFPPGARRLEDWFEVAGVDRFPLGGVILDYRKAPG